MNPLPQSKNTTIVPLFIALTLGCFALAPQARATCQEGCLINTNNTVLGNDALISLTHGIDNTAIGNQALYMNTSGGANTAIGMEALYSNTRGVNNTATGFDALRFNTIGVQNTANGLDALGSNTIGSFNTGIGVFALSSNTTGGANTAIGMQALFSNTHGSNNTANGGGALQFNILGNENVAIGYNALDNSTGNNNVALGSNAGANLTTGSNNIYIGNVGSRSGESATIRIGTAEIQTATFIAGIRDTPLANGAALAVGITADGQLGVRASSARFKESVKPMDKASEAIFSLQPVTFRYKEDAAAMPQFGLVAEEVAKVNPDLVARDVEGKPLTVRYDEINAMLLNEFLKEHKAFVEEQRKVQEQGATIAELRSALAQQQKDFQATATRQQKQIEALTAGLQKVSAQLELRKSAPQTVLNNQ